LYNGARPLAGTNFIGMNDTKIPDERALRMLVETPEEFTIISSAGEEVTLTLYPLQLSRLAMISERLLKLDTVFDASAENAVQQMWRICAEQPRSVAEIIAISTLQTKRDIEDHLKERVELIYDSPTMLPAAYVNIFSSIVYQSYYADFMNAIRSVRMLQVEISPEMTARRIAITGEEASGGK